MTTRPAALGPQRVAVIGAGWAGLAAAVEASRRGARVTLFEMAAHAGGRSRSVASQGLVLDNGQHILIGAYTATLDLLRTVGIDPETAMQRLPLSLVRPSGHGLQLRPGAPVPAFIGAVLRQRHWPLATRAALLRAAATWAVRGFRCSPTQTVEGLTAGLPAEIRRELIEPLCVAALNTPASDASAAVFLRVLKDALFAGPGSADLLLPAVPLGELLPKPALRWLGEHGAELRCGHRVGQIARSGSAWAVDAVAFDHVVLATPALEAARLTATAHPAWSAIARDFAYEPIVTVYLQSDGTALPLPMLALDDSADAPAQFVFDRGRLGGPPGLLAMVVSGARPWVDRGLDATADAARAQAATALAPWLASAPTVVRTLIEKRATFRCTPGLRRPASLIAPGLHAAGDYVEGPYPATLEGAVRSGIGAVAALGQR